MSALMNASPGARVRPSTTIGPHANIWLSGSAEIAAGRLDAGQRRDPPPQLAVGEMAVGALRVALALHRQLEREHAGRIEARRHGGEARDAAHDQRRADEQHHRERDLGDDEQPAQAVSAPPQRAGAAGAAPGVVEIARQVQARQPPRRRQPEQQPGRDRQDRRVKASTRASRPIASMRGTLPRPSAWRPCTPAAATSRPSQPARAGEQQRSVSSWRTSRAAPAPMRGADRHLAAPADRAGQQQVRDVGAGDQQHEADGADEDPQRTADVADDLLAAAARRRTSAAVGRIDGGMLAAEARRQRVHPRLRRRGA